jgi:CspA family cold shock protein
VALGRGLGVIKCWFGGQDGYGFIHPESGGEPVFVHRTGISTHAKEEAEFSLSEGARVTYEVVHKGMAGLWAKNVCRAD